LSEYHDNRPIHAFVNSSPDHKTVGFLELVPQIAETGYSKFAPHDIWKQMRPSHRDEKWSTLEGCRNWFGYDYILVANGHLELGKRIETWLPELETDYTYDLKIPEIATTYARELVNHEKDYIILYFSGIGPNLGFHAHTWSMAHWSEVVQKLNAEGHVPVVVGANTPSDLGYMHNFKNMFKHLNLKFVDTVGKTNLAQVFSLIRESSVWCGLNSGLGIVSASQGVPTVMLWSDRRYPIKGVRDWVYLHENMQTAYLNENQLKTTRALSFGSPELTPDAVVKNILEVKR